jgi:hypothetical protein
MTQNECWKAINEGKKLISKNTGVIAKLSEDGRARTDGTGTVWQFNDPKVWKIYEEPILYYKWKKVNQGDVILSKWTTTDLSKNGWVRIEPGKSFEEIT